MITSWDETSLLRMIHGATAASNYASDVRAAAATVLEKIREVTGWPLGSLYLLGTGGDRLEPAGVWSVSDPDLFAPFLSVTRGTSYPPGRGLVARVLASGHTLWATGEDESNGSMNLAATVGLHGCLAFPIVASSGVVGALEFYSSKVIRPDDPLIAAFEQIGRQLGCVVERERANAALAASEASLRAFVDSAVDAIVVADDNGLITAWNGAAEWMFGYRREEIVGQPLSMLMPERFRDAHNSGLARVRAGGGSRSSGRTMELIAVHRDGREFPIELSLSSWERQGLRSFAAVVRDITVRRAAEESAHLQQERLRQEAKMDSIGALAGGIAHDFNNVLTAIFGATELLGEEIPRESPLREHLTVIRDAAERAAGTTRHLLAFSGRQILRLTNLDVNALIIGQLQTILSGLIPESIHFELKLQPGLPVISADYHQLEQVVLSLVINSRDSMPGGGHLTVSTSRASLDETHARLYPGTSAGPHVCIAVSDTGVGMDASTRARIFEPFFTARGGVGSGFGLATVYGIVRQSRGSLLVRSEPGRGSVFEVYLPIAVAPPASVPAQPMARRPGSQVVLIVEDDAAIRDVAARVLTRGGYSVVEASSAEDALRIDRRTMSIVDLLVTDVVLPGKNGRELADILMAEYPGLRVLFVSGYTEDAIVQSGVLEKGVAFLPKPFTLTALMEQVRSMLDDRLAEN